MANPVNQDNWNPDTPSTMVSPTGADPSLPRGYTDPNAAPAASPSTSPSPSPPPSSSVTPYTPSAPGDFNLATGQDSIATLRVGRILRTPYLNPLSVHRLRTRQALSRRARPIFMGFTSLPRRRAKNLQPISPAVVMSLKFPKRFAQPHTFRPVVIL
jgi:hypothetical protein